MKTKLWLWLALAVIARGAMPVEVATKAGEPWKIHPTRTLADLPALAAAQPDAALDDFGGRADRRVKATGFFRVEEIAGRWWLIDPQGGMFILNSAVEDLVFHGRW